MPHGIHQTYEGNRHSIQKLAGPDRERGVNILRWLTFGYRALTVQEVAETFVIDLDDTTRAFCEDDLPA